MRRALNPKSLVAAALLAMSACSTTGGDGRYFSAKPTDNGDASADSPGAGQEASLPDGFINTDVAPPDSPPLTDANTCSAQTQKAQRYPVDMVIMMDQSGSMNDKAGNTNQTKWAAVVKALKQFMNEPASAGLGVGIQYFPQMVSATMETCDPAGILKKCPAGQNCLDEECMMECQGPSDCPEDECVMPPIGAGYCSNVKCDPSAYSKMQVEIGVLPAVAPKIVESMLAQEPGDNTPTAPALKGALLHAQDWASKNKDHKVIVVLATDGQPTVCSRQKTEADLVAQCASDAKEASEADIPIRTFVIGVMKTGENLQPNLDAIAKAGATDQALMIDSDQDVTTLFADALQKIRGNSLACEFRIPETDAGSLDYKRVNISLTVGSEQAETIYYVDDEGQCDSEKGGWHYDSAPSDSTTPTRILLCPKSCDQVMVDKETQIDIQIGCVTQIRPPA